MSDLWVEAIRYAVDSGERATPDNRRTILTATFQEGGQIAEDDWAEDRWKIAATVDGLMFGRVYLTDNWHAEQAGPELRAACERKAKRLRRAVARWDGGE